MCTLFCNAAVYVHAHSLACRQDMLLQPDTCDCISFLLLQVCDTPAGRSNLYWSTQKHFSSEAI